LKFCLRQSNDDEDPDDLITLQLKPQSFQHTNKAASSQDYLQSGKCSRVSQN
jgi:hypothetical protein